MSGLNDVPSLRILYNFNLHGRSVGRKALVCRPTQSLGSVKRKTRYPTLLSQRERSVALINDSSRGICIVLAANRPIN